MSRSRPLELERLGHVARQMLRSRDFRDGVRYESELVAWHQRAVHDAYGIVAGLFPHEHPDYVTVTPGVAFDCTGTALVLSEQRRIGYAKAPRTTLLIRARERGGEAELAWVDPRCVTPAVGVPIAEHEATGLRRTEQPTATRVLAEPRVVAGVTARGGTPWKLWTIPLGRGHHVIGIQVHVDTRAAGFVEEPCYFAALQWPGVASARLPAEDFRLAGAQSVQLESVDGFMFRIGFLRSEAGESDLLLAYDQELHVSWLGIERKGGHEPLR